MNRKRLYPLMCRIFGHSKHTVRGLPGSGLAFSTWCQRDGCTFKGKVVHSDEEPMRGYGLPNDDIASPDKLDLVNYARASHVGRFPSKSGDYKNSFRSSSAKRNQRRVYKRLARNAAKRELQEEMP